MSASLRSPNASVRSSLLAIKPLETLVKMVCVCSTSSMSVSLCSPGPPRRRCATTMPGLSLSAACLRASKGARATQLHGHFASPFQDFVLVACQLEAQAALLQPHHRHVRQLDLVARREDRHSLQQLDAEAAVQPYTRESAESNAPPLFLSPLRLYAFTSSSRSTSSSCLRNPANPARFATPLCRRPRPSARLLAAAAFSSPRC